MTRRLGGLLGLTMTAVALFALAPEPRGLLDGLRHPQDWVGVHGADRAVLTVTAVLAWAMFAWLAVGLLLTLVAELPGLAGTVGRTLVGAVLPRAVRQGMALALGAGLVVGGPAAWAAPPVPGPAASPAGTAADAGTAAPAGGVVLDWPTRPPDPPAPAPQEASGPEVLVRPGDSLWRIAQDRLGPGADAGQIAAAVASWYATNADTIGADPDLIRPGQQLTPPPAGASG